MNYGANGKITYKQALPAWADYFSIGIMLSGFLGIIPFMLAFPLPYLTIYLISIFLFNLLHFHSVPQSSLIIREDGFTHYYNASYRLTGKIQGSIQFSNIIHYSRYRKEIVVLYRQEEREFIAIRQRWYNRNSIKALELAFKSKAIPRKDVSRSKYHSIPEAW